VGGQGVCPAGVSATHADGRAWESNPLCLVRPNGSGSSLLLEPALVHIEQIERQSGAEGRAVVFLVDEIVPGFEREG
jgi:hypothetical protein